MFNLVISVKNTLIKRSVARAMGWNSLVTWTLNGHQVLVIALIEAAKKTKRSSSEYYMD